MNIYAESSAVLAWLLGEAAGRRVREVLRHAELVMASDVVLIECDRVLIRAVTLGEIDEAKAADRRAYLNAAASHWHLCRLSLDIVDRARHAFPAEPVRTLDAIHLASALAVRSTVPSTELLSLDDRIRRAGEAARIPTSTQVTSGGADGDILDIQALGEPGNDQAKPLTTLPKGSVRSVRLPAGLFHPGTVDRR